MHPDHTESKCGPKTAVVTGGSGAIGRACGVALRAQGYEVLLAARRVQPLEAAADEVGGRWISGDCSNESDVDRIMEAAGEVDVLVHAAGMYEGGFVREQSVDVFDRIISSTLRSAYLLTRAVLPRMSAGARIIYISSVTGLKGVKGMAAYSSSKAGLVALAQSVAGEVERDGIGVHLVTPGPVRTDMTDPETNPDSGVRQWTLEPEDVASAVAWLVQLPPRIVVRDIVMRSATTGPFAPKPIGAS